MWEDGLIRKLRLISKFMTSQPGKQTSTIRILLNISRSEVNETMKFDELMEFNMRNDFFLNHVENEAERLVSDLFLFF